MTADAFHAPEPTPPGPIAGYALIGDCGTAALVSDRGSIDWLCLPRFDSDPVFARLLDPGGGHCTVRPAQDFTATSGYLDGTAVVATTFTTETGRATVYDFFVAESRDAKRSTLWPLRYLVRRIAGESGVVRFHITVAPRDAFGGGRYRLRGHGHRMSAERRGRALLVQSSVPLHIVGGDAHAEVEVGAGQLAHLAMAYAGRDLGVWPPVGAGAEEAFRRTVAEWHAWSGRAGVDGDLREHVQRSALVLKLLTYAPSGAVIAAPTTSLPETLGGVRNWDYRYSWVRDASWTVTALDAIGYEREAGAYFFWALNAARLTQPRVRTMYTLHGGHRAPERELGHLAGFEGARPVRVGNGAAEQLQLDNWGHIVDAAFTHAQHGDIGGDAWSSLRAFVDYAAGNWWRPDQGIWEVRGPARHFVHSKVMCWVALDRGVRFVRELGFRGPADEWERECERIRDAVLRHGVDAERGTLMRAFDDPSVDASLLLVPTTGFLPGDDPRVLRTIDRIREELGRDELVYRYRGDDGLPGNEGAFLACSFWLAHALALARRVDEAREVFERACARANHAGLLPEEIDPDTGIFLGNFPQGLSHIALLNAAVALEHAQGESHALPVTFRPGGPGRQRRF